MTLTALTESLSGIQPDTILTVIRTMLEATSLPTYLWTGNY